MLFFPSKYPDGEWDPVDLEFEDVWISSGFGAKIHGWYCPCDKPRAHVVYMHGNAGNLTHRTELLIRLQRQLKVSVFIFDYRGYGRSTGRSTVFSVVKDARAAARYLATRTGVSETDLLFMGRSLGGAVATALAAEMQPRGLVVMSAFSSLKKVAAHHYSALSMLVPSWILNTEAAIQNYSGRLLLSHGKSDLTIPYQQGVEIFDAASEPKSFFPIKNAGHNGPSPEAYYDALDRFIANAWEANG